MSPRHASLESVHQTSRSSEAPPLSSGAVARFNQLAGGVPDPRQYTTPKVEAGVSVSAGSVERSVTAATEQPQVVGKRITPINCFMLEVRGRWPMAADPADMRFGVQPNRRLPER